MKRFVLIILLTSNIVFRGSISFGQTIHSDLEKKVEKIHIKYLPSIRM